jgi:hypothetical protein
MFRIAISSNEQHGFGERRTLPAPVRSSHVSARRETNYASEKDISRGARKIFNRRQVIDI